MLSKNLNKFYNARADIYHLSESQDKFGGTKNEWEKMTWNEPCRLYGYMWIMTLDVMGKTYTVVMQLMISADVRIRLNDKIEVGADKYIAVKIVPRVTMQRASHKSVLLGRLDE